MFLIGIACLSVSSGVSIALVYEWLFSGLPRGASVSISSDSLMALMYFSWLSIILGIVGGYLIGRYLHLESFDKALTD